MQAIMTGQESEVNWTGASGATIEGYEKRR